MRRALVSALVLFVGACHTDTTSSAPLPPAKIRLLTDAMGITHVFATTDADAFYGGGYAMARDRLFQMEVYRRQAMGTSAEILGSGSIDADLGARTFDFKRLGTADEARARAEEPDDAALVDAWILGVNARIAEVRSGKAPRPYGLGRGELDFVPADWVAADAFSVGKLLAFGLSNTLDQDILGTAVLRLAPTFAKKVPFLQPAYDAFTMGRTPTAKTRASMRMSAPRREIPTSLAPAKWPFFRLGDSNNWAVDAKHSANGHPLMAGDPHQTLTSPSRLWPVHLSSAKGAGKFDVVGFSFPGTPGVQMGHNEHIGWAATTNFADAMDIWNVYFDESGKAVELGDGDHAIVSRQETIRYKGTSGALESMPFTIEEVPGYGVLLPDQVLPVPRELLADGDAVLFNWTGFAPTRELSCYLGIDRAGNVDDFEAAVDLMDVGAVNFVAIDEAHIDYHVHAMVPDRGDPSAHPMPWHMLEGSDRSGLWTGAMLGKDKLPHWKDPARGYLVTANNDPWGFTADGNVENDPFYYGAYFANGFRAQRIEDGLVSLLARGRVEPEDLEALQDDTHSLLRDVTMPLLTAAMAAIGKDSSLSAYEGRADLVSLAKALAAWDGSMDRTRGEPIAFTALAWFAVQRSLTPAITSLLFGPIASKSPPFFLGMLSNVLTSRFADASSLVTSAGGVNAWLVGSLDDTSKWMKSRFETTDPRGLRWGDFNTAAFLGAYGKEQDPKPIGVDGACDTVKVCESAFFGTSAPLTSMQANEASVFRIVTSFGPDGMPESVLDFQMGTNESPSSPHFADQNPAWVAGSHASLLFHEADVEKAATDETVLTSGL
jgi:penicillin amidase